MTISVNDTVQQVGAKHIEFQENRLYVHLTDGREIVLPVDQIDWLRWLMNATPEQRANWSLEPYGYAIYWEDLDDGFEIAHALTLHPVT